MDRDTLETWLKTRSRHDGLVLAHRAALRIFPFWGGSTLARNIKVSTLPVLRSLLTSRAIIDRSSAQLVVAATRAAESTAIITSAATAAATIDGAADAAAAFAAFGISRAAAFATNTTADNAGIAARAAAVAVSWREVEHDIDTLTAGQDLTHFPLWYDPIPKPFAHAETAALVAMTAEYGSDTSFWHRWWAGAKSGQWLNWDLQRDIALIPDEVWKSGIGPVMAEIARIEAGYDLGPPSLDQALATMAPADLTVRTSFAAAVWSHRQELPATLDALLGFCDLEIDRLQRKNYRDDDDREECQRQIRVLTTLHNAISRLAPLLQTASPMTADQAVIPEKLSRVAVKAFKEWPRKNMDDLADSSIRFALVGVAASGLMMMGIPASWAMGCTTALFGGKKIADAVKVASDSKSLSA